jgi:hypothetical protein
VVAGSYRKPQTYVKPEVAVTVFELLMMSGVSLETCCAIKKHWNNKFYYRVVSCWLFPYNLPVSFTVLFVWPRVLSNFKRITYNKIIHNRLIFSE